MEASAQAGALLVQTGVTAHEKRAKRSGVDVRQYEWDVTVIALTDFGEIPCLASCRTHRAAVVWT